MVGKGKQKQCHGKSQESLSLVPMERFQALAGTPNRSPSAAEPGHFAPDLG